MITISKQYKLNSGVAPFILNWKSSNTCARVKSWTNDGNILDVTFEFDSEDCLNYNSVFTFNVTDAEKCDNKYDVTVANPCTDFDFLFNNGIQHIKGLVFKAQVPSKEGPFVWKWTFDQSVFKIVRQEGDEVELEVIGRNVKHKDVFQIDVAVTNKYGCCIESSLNYEFCAPTALKSYANDLCYTEVVPFTLSYALCGDSGTSDCPTLAYVPINFERTRFITPDGFTIQKDPAIENRFYITVAKGVPAGTYNIVYTIVDVNGVESSSEVCVTVVECSENLAFNIYGSSYLFGCTQCEPDEDFYELKSLTGPFNTGQCSNGHVSVSLEDNITGTVAPDWSTFTFVPKTGQILSNNKELITEGGIATLNENREVVFESNSNLISETVTVYLKSKGGKNSAKADFSFSANVECGDKPYANDDIYYVKEGDTLNFNPTINDVGDWTLLEFMGPLPPVNGGILTFNTGTGNMVFRANGTNMPDSYEFQYRIQNSKGTYSDPANVTIYVNKLEGTDSNTVNICRINSDVVDVFSYLKTNDKTGSWTYLGREKLYGDRFQVNSEPLSYYDVKEIIEPKSYQLIVDFTESVAGTHYFEYSKGQGSYKIFYTVPINIIDPVEMPSNVSVLSCISDPEFDIRVHAPMDLPTGGTWFNVIPGTGPVTNFMFNPQDEGVGTHRFTYTVNTNGCSAVWTLDIVVAAQVYAGEDVCIKVCSVGPDPGDEEYCRNASYFQPDPTVPSCVFCLGDQLFINPGKFRTTGGKWYLESAPINTVYLIIGGVLYKVKVGDELPAGGDNPCIDFNKAVLGDYTFKYVVDNGCTDDAIVEFAVFPAPCELPDEVSSEVCVAIDTTLYTFLTNALLQLGITNCAPNETGNWTLVSGPGTTGIFISNDDDGTNDYISTEAIPGDYRFLYEYRQDNIESPNCSSGQCASECETCTAQIFLNLEYGAGPDLGEADKWAVCNGVGGCEFPLKELAPDAPNTNLVWYYSGYNSISPNQPNPAELGNIPDIVTNRPGMYNVGDIVLAAHTANANDTDSLPIINFEGALEGYYFFKVENCVGGCCSELDVVLQVVTSPNAGTDGECLTLCTSKPECVDLYCLLGGTPGTQGQWRVISAFDCSNFPLIVPTASGPCTGNGLNAACAACSQFGPLGDPGFYPGNGNTARFNTTNQPCGTYVFGYRSSIPTLGPDFFLYNCATCAPQEAQVTIMITTAENPGPGGTGNTCA